MLGYRGHFSTKSRRYSTTLGALRNARRTHAAAQARARHGGAQHDHHTTRTDSAWRYLTTGYSPGEELLAETTRRNRTAAEQLRYEGGPPE